MKIGILKETKVPVDNRVALTPGQVRELSLKYPNTKFKVQKSDLRAYTDDEYSKLGIEVADCVDDCEFLLGIKEADIRTLKENKHYMFFGHIAKMQPYNKPLFKTLLDKNISFSDYEYLVDSNGQRLVAFGWYAGVVGLYYTLRGWGIKNRLYELPKPDIKFSMSELINNLKGVEFGNIKIVITGNGRVSQGAQYILNQIGAVRLSPCDFVNGKEDKGLVYCVAALENLVASNNPKMDFNHDDFVSHPENYHSIFMPFAYSADILLSCHFWRSGQPVYLTKESFLAPDFRIRMIGDITCDIQGSIQSTLRSSTHDDPFYDYNPMTGLEESAFSSPDNVTVMAVDTCPNALPRETSEYFGENLIKYVLGDLLDKGSDRSIILDRATIVRDGKLTERFNHLSDYVASL